MKSIATTTILALYGLLMVIPAGLVVGGINRDDDALYAMAAVSAGVLCLMATVAVRGIWSARQE